MLRGPLRHLSIKLKGGKLIFINQGRPVTPDLQGDACLAPPWMSPPIELSWGQRTHFPEYNV